MSVGIGERLSHYRILAKLGEGGMGIVYKAEDEKLHRLVALKVLRSDVLGDEERQQRFLREARSAAAVAHPYIAGIYEADEADGTTFITMEFVEGQTLRSLLRKGALPVRDALRIGTEIAEGLARAHEAHIVHRDLKPENVMVRPDGHVKILDFGLAKLVERRDEAVGSTVSRQETATADLTGRGEILGTPAYMSPEQARGQSVDHRSDVFSLGTTLYETITGKHPFRGQTEADTLSSILREQPAPPTQRNADVPQELERILDKCLEKDPSDRYQHAEDLVVDLKHLQREAGSRAREAAPPSPMPTKKPWTRILGPALVAIAFVAILVLAWQKPWESHQAREKPGATIDLPVQQPDVASVAVLPFTDMSAEKDQEYFSDGIAEELLNALARIPGLRVTGRTSSFSFKGKNEDLRVIGQKLNVGAILEGSVRKAGKRVRITAQLVNSADGFHLWSETYDRTLDDIFAVQEDIASSVAGALKVTLLGNGPKARGTNVEAYNAYLQAEYFFNQGSKEDLESAVGYYQQSLALDPDYAMAWARLAAAQVWRAANVYVPLDEGFRIAREAAERALELDANLAEAHSVLGTIRTVFEWDWTGAETEIKRALALEPGNAAAVQRAGGLAFTLGRQEEAVQLNRRAVELDALNVYAWRGLGVSSWYAGRLDEADVALTKALELSPEYPTLHSYRSWVYLSQGQPEEALAEAERETHPANRLQALAVADHALGRDQDADAALGELIEQHQDGWAFQIAEVYASRGDADQAFAWLERAYSQRDTGLSLVKGDPLLRSIEGDPRYAAFLKKMGLPL